MNFGIEAFLDEVDHWKFKAHEQLKDLTAKQRQALWDRIARKARAMGLPIAEPTKPAKRTMKRARRTG
jgi:hypothetical protein